MAIGFDEAHARLVAGRAGVGGAEGELVRAAVAAPYLFALPRISGPSSTPHAFRISFRAAWASAIDASR